jgi:hypothetical protein
MLLNAVFAFFLNVVFNRAMNTHDQIQADKELIEQFGGPTKLAKILGYEKVKGGAQRVHNWLTRGIPARVKLDRPDVFRSPKRKPPKVPT